MVLLTEQSLDSQNKLGLTSKVIVVSCHVFC